MSELMRRMQESQQTQRQERVYDKYKEYEEFKGSELVGYGLPELYLLFKNPTYKVAGGPDLNAIYQSLLSEGIKEEEMGVIGTDIYTRNPKAIESLPMLTEEINYGKRLVTILGTYYSGTRGYDLKGMAYTIVKEIEDKESIMDKQTLDYILDTIDENILEEPKPKDFRINNVTMFSEYISNPVQQAVITKIDVSRHEEVPLVELHETLEGRIEDLVYAIEFIDDVIARRIRHRKNTKEAKAIKEASKEIRVDLISTREEGAIVIKQISEQMHSNPSTVEEIRALERYREHYEPMDKFEEKIKFMSENLKGISIDEEILQLKEDDLTSKDRAYGTLRERLYDTIKVESKKYDYMTHCINTGGKKVADYFSKLV